MISPDHTRSYPITIGHTFSHLCHTPDDPSSVRVGGHATVPCPLYLTSAPLVTPGHTSLTWLVTPYHTRSHVIIPDPMPGHTWSCMIMPDHSWSHLIPCPVAPRPPGHTWPHPAAPDAPPGMPCLHHARLNESPSGQRRAKWGFVSNKVGGGWWQG